MTVELLPTHMPHSDLHGVLKLAMVECWATTRPAPSPPHPPTHLLCKIPHFELLNGCGVRKLSPGLLLLLQVQQVLVLLPQLGNQRLHAHLVPPARGGWEAMQGETKQHWQLPSS